MSSANEKKTTKQTGTKYACVVNVLVYSILLCCHFSFRLPQYVIPINTEDYSFTLMAILV